MEQMANGPGSRLLQQYLYSAAAKLFFLLLFALSFLLLHFAHFAAALLIFVNRTKRISGAVALFSFLALFNMTN